MPTNKISDDSNTVKTESNKHRLTKEEKLKIKRERQERYANTFQIGKFENISLKSGSVKFKSLYDGNATWKRYLVAIGLGISMAIIVLFMLKNTGLYNSGLSAIMQGISRFTYTEMMKHNVSRGTAELIFNLMFWGLYFIFNIPLFVFGYFKIGKTFSILTLVYLSCNTLVGLGLSEIPHISDVFIFGNTLPHGDITSAGIDHIYKGANIFAHNGVYVLPFYFNPKPGMLNGETFTALQVFDNEHDPTSALFLFIYALVYGLASALCYSLLYIVGSCTAGLDFISIYYATIKHKSLGTTLIIINSLSMLVGASIGSYGSAAIINNQGSQWQFFFSANLVASFVSVLVFGIILNRLYPIRKQVRVEIHSANYEAIRNELFASQYNHSITLVDTVGGYSMQKRVMILTICLYVELPLLITHIRKVDGSCLISVSEITDIDGQMRVYQQGTTE